MNKHTLPALISLTLASSYPSSVSAAQQYFQARNDAMGGTGVASTHYLSAPLSNPALLARFSRSDDIGILLPAVGLQVADEEEMFDGINNVIDLADELDQYSSNTFASRAVANQLADELETLDGNQAPVQLGLAAVIAIPGRYISFALFSNSYLDLQVETDVDEDDLSALRGINPTGRDELTSQIMVQGAGVTDLGISLASKFILGTTPVYIGVSPKLQAIGLYNYTDSISDFNASDLEQDENIDDSVEFNLDAGFVVEPNEHFTFGLSAKNLIEHEISSLDKSVRYQVKPHITTGFALHSDWFTAALDIDVTQTRSFSNSEPSKYARVGAEMDAGGWVQLRAGYRHDLEENTNNQVTFGVGLSPFEAVNLDLTGMLGDEGNYGVVAQTSFTF
jgi:hypothetical protein